MKNNIIKNYFNDSLNVKPNFNEFVDKKKIEFTDENEKKQLSIFNGSKLKLSLYTLTIVIVAVFSTIFISNIDIGDNNSYGKNNQHGNNNAHNISPKKNGESLIERNIVDELIAFGPDHSRNLFKSDIVFKSNIISEEDKSILKGYEENGYSNLFYNMYFGVKDGVDVICLHHLDKPFDILVFESNLNYSFQSIIDDFELQSNTELSMEFLTYSQLDSMGREDAGIIIYFNEVNSTFIPYYISIIQEKAYVVSK